MSTIKQHQRSESGNGNISGTVAQVSSTTTTTNITTSSSSLSSSSDWKKYSSDLMEHQPSSHYSPPQSPLSVSDPLGGYFQNLRSPDTNVRKSAVENIISLLTAPENEKLLRTNITNIVVLATESPFEEITDAFSTLLSTIQEKYHIPKQKTTSFINETQLPPLNSNDQLTKRLFQEAFLQSGRVNHIIRLLGWHPQYLERFLASYNKVMRDQGPLPLPWRNYIGILASARYNCGYLVALLEHEYLHSGGDPKWLQGVDHIPQKLKNLLKIVEMMAHQPWLLPNVDIEYLVKGQDAWSIAELVHAMILICTFLSLAGFVFSCGILPEYGLASTTTLDERTSFSLNESDCEVEDLTASENTIKVMELLKKKKEEQEEDDFEDGGPEIDRQQEFHNAGNIDADNSSSSSSGSSSLATTSSSTYGGIVDMSRYNCNNQLTHTDFDVSSKDYTIFSVQDYSWKEHGYELVSRIFPDAAPLLDEEFSFVYTMTYYRFNNSTDIDTLPFRRAVWYYVQRVKGMCHDDYNYQEVNMFLSRNLKYYVKKAVCFPDNISKIDYSKLGYDLKPDEKCHLALLAVCSHKQAALLYGLYTVMSYQNRR
ncbi:sestrin-like protein [Cavenderia fasciculata]|uniref:Sestrin-like protein n=1 Tax=Cavenderia fasciculata TaxID=261658 RepID=F4Q7E9_CACFS|nr:sestrin-like protein [Cavenderia fasciculata]EGG16331.1 sestrin-like protein [Cavenderia fasciculata]|eukprot:XP_004354715.1 sestrin-like protein [Cavenderia fasciculata]